MEITHVRHIVPAYNDHDSEVEEKKEQESIKDSNDGTANAVHHQLQNQESQYARCKPMAPSNSPDRKERCKPMAPMKPKLEYTSSAHIDPKMGHLKRVYMAVNRGAHAINERVRGALAVNEHVHDQAHLTQTSDWTKVILQHPQACNVQLKDAFNVIWDSGASFCITHDKRDFIGPIKQIKDASVNGINGPMEIIGSGRIRWSLLDTSGQIRHIELDCCYAPKATQRLLSTAAFLNEYPKNKITVDSKSWTIEADPSKPTEHPIDVEVNQFNNLPMSKCIIPESLHELSINFSENVTVTHEANRNLDEPQKELLRWHYRLGHRSLQDIQALLRTGALATTHAMRRLHKRAANLRHGEVPKNS